MENITKEEILSLWKHNIDYPCYNVMYIDIPFCTQYCNYCIYKKNKFKSSDISNYLDTLEEEMQFFSEAFKNKKISALHIGGGSPSILSLEQLLKIKKIIDTYYNIDLNENSSRTLELNPFDMSDEKLEIFRDGFFNRVSFGIQSFSEEVLLSENRPYVSPNEFKELILKLRRINHNININVDLIIGLNKSKKEDIISSFKVLDNLEINKITISENSNLPESIELDDYSNDISETINSIFKDKYINKVNADFDEKQKNVRRIIFFYNKKKQIEYDYIYGEVFSISNILSFGPLSKSFIKKNKLNYTRDADLDFKNSKYHYQILDIEENVRLTHKLFQISENKFRF